MCKIGFFRLLFSFSILYFISLNLCAQPLLTLEEAVKIALEKNFAIQLAKNDEEIARLQNNWGNAGRLPTVNASGGYNYSNNNLRQKLTNGTVIERNGADFQNQNASLVASWRVFNGWRVVAAKSRLEELEKIGILQVKEQANQSVYRVILAYLNVLRFQRQKQATLESISLFEERRKLAENRFRIGTAGKSDLLQALADLTDQRNNLIRIENNISLSKALLNNELSRNPDEPIITTDTLAKPVLPPREQLIVSIDTLNPMLLINKSQQVVLAQQYREVNSQRLPTLTINTGASFNNSQNSAGFTLRNTTFGPNIGATLAVPIYQGGVVKQQLRINEVLQKSQLVQYDQLRNQLATSLALAYSNFENGMKQYRLELENQEVVKENANIAMERFKNASITTVELRQTQLDIINAQTRMIEALYQMKQAEADVLLIMGKLVE
jgi:outer membrane protein TolC